MPLALWAENTEKIDSLEDRLEQTEQSKRAKILNELAIEYLAISPEQSRSYSNNALRLAKKYSQSSDEALALKLIGKAYHYEKDYEN
ncbi:MAG: hypothetical protein C0594_10330, partial [Marinilabiliales bacterium]